LTGMWLFGAFQLITAPIIVLCIYPSADTALEKKCLYLKTQTSSVYYDNSCFATTVETYSTTLADWYKLHKHCDILAGYKGRLAFILTRAQINALIADEVIEPRGRYFIGAKKDPPSDCGDRLCTYQDPEHHKNWYYIDAEGQKQGEVNADLWLTGEPNNAGTKPPENIVTLEHLGSARLGFNDANGEAQHFPLLCEYRDILVCPENYTLIGKTCYKVFTQKLRPSEAQAQCRREGGDLPSIHNERVNQHLAKMARQAAHYDYSRRSGELEQWGPFLIGLQYINGRWKWTDGTKTDYYRWYAKRGGSETMLNKPSDGYKYVFLQTTTNANDGVAGFGYWSNHLKSTDKVPFICQLSPTVDV
uniref:C-type lectin domain-containing protein n=1 Tax=Parascaris univalens TaxID=6257 RepID=A0A915APR4_PARUN